jgi:hypothetical protein
VPRYSTPSSARRAKASRCLSEHQCGSCDALYRNNNGRENYTLMQLWRNRADGQGMLISPPFETVQHALPLQNPGRSALRSSSATSPHLCAAVNACTADATGGNRMCYAVSTMPGRPRANRAVHLVARMSGMTEIPGGAYRADGICDTATCMTLQLLHSHMRITRRDCINNGALVNHPSTRCGATIWGTCDRAL